MLGLNEQEAQQAGVAYETTCFNLAELDRPFTEDAAHGYISGADCTWKRSHFGCDYRGGSSW